MKRFLNVFLSGFEWNYCAVSQNVIFLSFIYLHFCNCKYLTFFSIDWLAHSRYQDAKIFGTKVWGGVLGFQFMVYDLWYPEDWEEKAHGLTELFTKVFVQQPHKRLLLVSCSVSVVVIQHTMSTNIPLIYSMFGLAGTGGEGDSLWTAPATPGLLIIYRTTTMKQIIYSHNKKDFVKVSSKTYAQKNLIGFYLLRFFSFFSCFMVSTFNCV